MRTPDAGEPAFRSLTLTACPDPDHVDLLAIPLPRRAPRRPEFWARHVFSVASAPGWIRMLLAVRQIAVGLVGIPAADRHVFDVREVVGEEALIATADHHLDFWVGVGVSGDLLRLTTVVKVHHRRGRLYWAVVRPLHPIVVRAMMRRAVARPPRTSAR